MGLFNNKKKKDSQQSNEETNKVEQNEAGYFMDNQKEPPEFLNSDEVPKMSDEDAAKMLAEAEAKKQGRLDEVSKEIAKRQEEDSKKRKQTYSADPFG